MKILKTEEVGPNGRIFLHPFKKKKEKTKRRGWCAHLHKSGSKKTMIEILWSIITRCDSWDALSSLVKKEEHKQTNTMYEQ